MIAPAVSRTAALEEEALQAAPTAASDSRRRLLIIGTSSLARSVQGRCDGGLVGGCEAVSWEELGDGSGLMRAVAVMTAWRMPRNTGAYRRSAAGFRRVVMSARETACATTVEGPAAALTWRLIAPDSMFIDGRAFLFSDAD